MLPSIYSPHHKDVWFENKGPTISMKHGVAVSLSAVNSVARKQKETHMNDKHDTVLLNLNVSPFPLKYL